MRDRRSSEPGFAITHDAETPDTLVAGFSAFGLAGLTAVDYLVNQLEMSESGHLSAEGLPAITPFEEGRPRHHTRIFTAEEYDIAVLVGELIVPLSAASALSDAILGWSDENGVSEITILSGVPIAHGPEEHVPFYVATDDYRERRLDDTDIRPMGKGVLDGLSAELMEQGIDEELAVGLLTTPVHQQAPDVEAAIRLLDALTGVYGIELDTGPLEAFAAEVQQYYTALAERLESAEEPAGFEDRMYM
ncbi:MAG: proteasome assembly chaperone family protein [Haloarculaceae archaeon]